MSLWAIGTAPVGQLMTGNGEGVAPSFQAPAPPGPPPPNVLLAAIQGLFAGIIVQWSGLLANIPDGFLLCDGTNGTPDLRDKFIKGAAAAAEPGTTGGSATHTPSGTVSQPTFSGNTVTSTSTSGGTPAGTNSTSTVTPLGTNATSLVTPLGTNATSTVTPLGSVAAPTVTWPAGVPTIASTAATFAGNSVALASGVAAAQTFTGTPSSAIVNHVHPDTAVLSVQGGTTAINSGTHVMTSAATSGSVRAVTAGDSIAITAVNPTGGVSTVTPAGTNATSTVTGTTTATGTITITNQGVVSWPAGVPTNSTPAFTGASSTVAAQTFTGSASTVAAQTFTGAASTVGAQTFTGSALAPHTHDVTAVGNVSQPLFSGNSQNTEPAYYAVAYLMLAAA